MRRYYYGALWCVSKCKIIDTKRNVVILNRTSYDRSFCYGYIFNVLNNYRATILDGTYHIKCYKTFDESKNNYCFMSKHEILLTLAYMRRTFGIKTHLKENSDSYFITLKIVGKSIKHKYILAFSRIFYEYPYNAAVKDVFRLKQLKQWNDIYLANKDFLDLYTICVYSANRGVGSNHSIFTSQQIPLPTSKIKSRLNASVHCISNVNDNPRMDRLRIFAHDITDWDNDFTNRLPYYINNYKIIKDAQKNLRGGARD